VDLSDYVAKEENETHSPVGERGERPKEDVRLVTDPGKRSNKGDNKRSKKQDKKGMIQFELLSSLECVVHVKEPMQIMTRKSWVSIVVVLKYRSKTMVARWLSWLLGIRNKFRGLQAEVLSLGFVSEERQDSAVKGAS